MTTDNIFEQATRLKLRFQTPQGLITTEDLWDLPLTTQRANRGSLNDVGRDIAKALRDASIDDFVGLPTALDTALTLKLDIIKAIIKVRQDENAAAAFKAQKAAQKSRLLELIARKQDESLGAKSLEELQEMVNAL